MRVKRKLLTLFLILIISSAVLISGNVYSEDIPDLFTPAKSDAIKRYSIPVDSNRVYVDFDLSILEPVEISPQKMKASLPGRILILDKQRTEQRSAGNYSWIGRVEGDDLSTAVITVVDGILHGTITTSDGSYSIVPMNGVYFIVKKDPALAVKSLDDSKRPQMEEEPDIFIRRFALSAAAPQEDGSRIDLLVLYTRNMQTRYGSGLSSKIQHYVDMANAAYANNNITLQLRLVGTELFNDAGSAEGIVIDSSLNYITGTTGSCSSSNRPVPPPAVSTLRNSYNADLVTLLRVYDGISSSCGIAWTMNSLSNSCNEYFAYSVVEVKDAAEAAAGGYYCSDTTLAHEAGHNMGADHDRQTGCGGGLFSYSCGYFTPDRKYGTIMSYIGDTTITFFSTPLVTYNGYAVGVAQSSSNSADNAGTLGASKSVVANYRYAASSCTYSISPGSNSFSSSSGSGTITLTASTSGCSWTATSNAPWITVTAGGAGADSGTVSYGVSTNTTGDGRTGTITAGGQTLTIRQAKSLFVDDPNNWATNYIYAIYTDNITVGCGSGMYCPSQQVTRGQMAAFIIRAKYGETFGYTAAPYYSDVPLSNVFFKYVQRMKDDNITTTTGSYGVDTYVTREQMAAFIIRAKYGEAFGYTTTPYFSDVPSGTTFFKYVQKLKDTGLTTATGTYDAASVVPRDQMAAFIARAFLGMQ